jgi:hypothetical protein
MNGHNCDFSLFSLFWPEIYSEAHLVRRRNPGCLVIGPAKNSETAAVFCCISLFSAERYSAAVMCAIHSLFDGSASRLAIILITFVKFTIHDPQNA